MRKLSTEGSLVPGLSQVHGKQLRAVSYLIPNSLLHPGAGGGGTQRVRRERVQERFYSHLSDPSSQSFLNLGIRKLHALRDSLRSSAWAFCSPGPRLHKLLSTESLPRLRKFSGHPRSAGKWCVVTRATHQCFSPCCLPMASLQIPLRRPGWGPRICTETLRAQAEVEHTGLLHSRAFETPQGCPTFCRLWAPLEEELSGTTH